ncbi:MAG TPA: excinuclease ABC subunit C [Desulfobulbaceae bacterium]|nr:excinuclease ABC subunit C [Desulfobulbaceae bacterium]
MPEKGNNLLAADFLRTVSTGPGVYQMLGKKEVLYVGKAVNLRKRLASYRRHSDDPHSRIGLMLDRAERIETILTTTEKEALILEASLIKKHRPRYNVILRDDKSYPLIKVTVQDKWPRIKVTRKRIRDGSRYFGPYASVSAMRETLRLLQAFFPLRRCPQVKPRSRPCLNFQIGRCLGPCALPVNSDTYAALVREVLMVLEGRNQELAAMLQEKMKAAALALHFEEAALLRDRLKGLAHTLERQVVAAEHGRDQDVYGLARNETAVGIAILFVRAGLITGAQTFFLADPIGSDQAILAETIIQYYSPERQPPAELLLPLVPEDKVLLQERLTELHEAPVRLQVPLRGPRLQLMGMARQNATQVFAEQDRKHQAWGSLAASLKKSLHLRRDPNLIECIDISNISGKQAVGSLVCFREGVKYPQGYRHYRITGKEEPDDYAMMREVLSRRLAKGISDDNLPDLLLLDGGKGQLNLAAAALDHFGLGERIDLVAIAKEKEEEGEKLFRPGRKNPLLLPHNAPALLFLMRMRDEAHRFGITRHRRLRSRKSLASELDALQGIGATRKLLLLKTFGSIKRIRDASLDELRGVPGIGAALAASIHRQLHTSDAA